MTRYQEVSVTSNTMEMIIIMKLRKEEMMPVLQTWHCEEQHAGAGRNCEVSFNCFVFSLFVSLILAVQVQGTSLINLI